MRGSNARAAASARRASSMRASTGTSRSSGRRGRGRAGRFRSPASGGPAWGSGAVARARATASSAMRVDGVRGEVAGGGHGRSEAIRAHRPGRGCPARCSWACLTKSISSPRTRASSESSLDETASASRRARAPGGLERVGHDVRGRRLLRSRAPRRVRCLDVASSHPSVPPTVSSSTRIVGKPDADGHALAVLAAGADARDRARGRGRCGIPGSARPGRCRSASRP